MMNIHQIKIFKFGGEITIHNQFGHVAPPQISTPFPNRESRTRFGHKIGRTWWPMSRRARRRFATSARRDSVPSRLASNSAARASFAAVSGAACPNSISRQKGGEGYQRRRIRPSRVYRLSLPRSNLGEEVAKAKSTLKSVESILNIQRELFVRHQFVPQPNPQGFKGTQGRGGGEGFRTPPPNRGGGGRG